MADFSTRRRFHFPDFGLYPLADSAAWVERLVLAGVELVQVRLKNRPDADPDHEISLAVAAARAAGAQIVVNEHWRQAVFHGAGGVHLGRADWKAAHIAEIRAAGLTVGVSVHDAAEISEAMRFQPDYLTLGTVFPTRSKNPETSTLGPGEFRALRAAIPQPTAAIGGVSVENADSLLSAGADAICVISDLRNAPSLVRRVGEWRLLFSRYAGRGFGMQQ